MTASEWIGIFSSLATVAGVLIALLVVLRDRVELKELESVTGLISAESPRIDELRVVQAELLDRYLRAARRRRSGTTRMLWTAAVGILGLLSYGMRDASSVFALLAFALFVVAMIGILPFYGQLAKELWTFATRRRTRTISVDQ